MVNILINNPINPDMRNIHHLSSVLYSKFISHLFANIQDNGHAVYDCSNYQLYVVYIFCSIIFRQCSCRVYPGSLLSGKRCNPYFRKLFDKEFVCRLIWLTMIFLFSIIIKRFDKLQPLSGVADLLYCFTTPDVTGAT